MQKYSKIAKGTGFQIADVHLYPKLRVLNSHSSSLEDFHLGPIYLQFPFIIPTLIPTFT